MARMRSRLETGEALRSWTLPWLEELDTWKRTKLGSGYNHPQTSLVEWQGHPHTIRRSFFFHHYQSHPATIRVEAEMDHLVHRRPSVEPTRGPKDPEAGSCPLQGLSIVPFDGYFAKVRRTRSFSMMKSPQLTPFPQPRCRRPTRQAPSQAYSDPMQTNSNCSKFFELFIVRLCTLKITYMYTEHLWKGTKVKLPSVF